MRRFVRRPSPAMLVAMVALVIALGGNAIADQVNAVIAKIKANSVTSGSVKNGSLLLKDFKPSEAAKLKGATGPAGAAGAAGAAGPQGPAGTPNGYTKDEANAAFLGKTDKAADANKLDGKDGSEFIQGQGTAEFGSALLNPSGSSSPLVTIPGLGHLNAACDASEHMSITFTNDSGSTVDYTYGYYSDGAGKDVDGNTVANGATSVGLINGLADGNDYIGTLQLVKGNFLSGESFATVQYTAVNDPGGASGKCRIQAHSVTGFTNGLSLIFLPFKGQK